MSGSSGSPLNQAGSILPEVVTQVVALLRAHAGIIATLTDSEGRVKVWNNIPQGTVPPYLWVWSGEEDDVPQKLGAGHYGRTCTVIVYPVSRHRGTQEIDELGSLVMQALERQPLSLSAYRQAGIVWAPPTGRATMADVEGGPQITRELIFRATAR